MPYDFMKIINSATNLRWPTSTTRKSSWFFSFLCPKIENLISSPIDQCNLRGSFQCCYIGMTWAIVIWDFDDVNKEYFSGKHLYLRNIADRFHFSKVMMCTLLSVKKFSIWNKRVQNAFIISVALKCTATRKFM